MTVIVITPNLEIRNYNVQSTNKFQMNCTRFTAWSDGGCNLFKFLVYGFFYELFFYSVQYHFVVSVVDFVVVYSVVHHGSRQGSEVRQQPDTGIPIHSFIQLDRQTDSQSVARLVGRSVGPSLTWYNNIWMNGKTKCYYLINSILFDNHYISSYVFLLRLLFLFFSFCF